MMVKPLFTGSEWNFEILENVYNACETVAFDDLNLNIYQTQLIFILKNRLTNYISNLIS